MGGVQGPATDIDIEAREIIKMRERLSQIIATETGQSIERVRNATIVRRIKEILGTTGQPWNA
jgi:ATP-dependent Clp protease protease subunit